uniref:Ig-like domain-containing protein n=1 Tax=Leptobrachium leishanense TaxID=445787 RepID=A0A8C5MJ88_9ANUR
MLHTCLVLTVLSLFSRKGCVHCVRVTMRESVVVGEAGARVTLPCSYSTDPGSSFNIQWKFAAGNTLPSEGVQIYYFSRGVSYKPSSQGDRLTIAHNPPTSGDASIQLSDIRPSDNGSYMCEVNNPPDFSGTGYGIVQFTVLAPPSTPSCQMSGTPSAGYDLTLRCSSSGGNPPPIYSWSFLGSKTPLQPGMMENQRTGSLILTNLSRALSGSYRCTASNELGQATCDLNIVVTSSSSAGAVTGAVIGVSWLCSWLRRWSPIFFATGRIKGRSRERSTAAATSGRTQHPQGSTAIPRDLLAQTHATETRTWSYRTRRKSPEQLVLRTLCHSFPVHPPRNPVPGSWQLKELIGGSARLLKKSACYRNSLKTLRLITVH